ncbi:MAG: tRNA pseudouridine(38-40) synthase TruA [Lachnospiraceae bacterium]|nr:tRNA pseudouridine(38-40) synthase TruA [Lachnospiraceae bacterium]
MSEARRIMIKVAYDGKAYHGWQAQEGMVTIESRLNEALCELLKEDIAVSGASRTDAGVHAKGNLAVFDTHARIPAEKVAAAMNTKLPEDIVVLESEEVAPDFHPRHCHSIKTYEYRILNTAVRDPLKNRYAHWTYVPLDVERMKEAAVHLVGEHDYTSFCSVHAQTDTRVRTIYSLDVTRIGEEISIVVKGNGFLYNMVRIIAGTLMEVGRGHMEASKVKEILETRDRHLAGPTAPPNGLCLINIELQGRKTI